VAPPPPPPPLALSAGGSFLATSLRCSFTPAAAAATAAGAIPGLSQQPHVSLHHGIKSQQPKNAARWWCARSRPAIPTDRAGTEGVCGAGAHAPSLQKDVPCLRHRQQRPSRYPGGPPAAAAARVARGEGGRPSSHGSAAGVNGRCARKTSCGRPVQGLQRSRCSLTAGQAVAACCMRPTDNTMQCAQPTTTTALTAAAAAACIECTAVATQLYCRVSTAVVQLYASHARMHAHAHSLGSLA
jgi:hypothetical protein